MKALLFFLLILTMSSFSYCDTSYLVENVALNTCDCSSTSVTTSYKIKPGFCIFSLSGEIKSGKSSTILDGHIVTVSEKIFSIAKDCKSDLGRVRIVYHDENPVAELVEIFRF